ncbi:DDE_3 domain-containing protein [Trichonephila clavipes]|nr:DDE_3 domain-containing protein [Trichonephila clavipes]
MSPGLASKSIVGIFSFGVNLKLFCNHGTSVKEMHMDPGLVSVWDSISLGGRTDLHVFSRGNVNSHTYRDDILDAYGLPYVGAIGDAFVLQGDNARLHRSRIVDAYLEQETIQRIQWQARSPRLNPIEQLPSTHILGPQPSFQLP